MTLKQMALRHDSACRVCGVELPAKTWAVYDFTAKNVLCLGCRDDNPTAQQESLTPRPDAQASVVSRREQDRRAGDRRQTADATAASSGHRR